MLCPCLQKNTVTGKVKNKENKTEDFRGENITLFILHFHKSAFFFLIYISVAHLVSTDYYCRDFTGQFKAP